MCDTAEERAHFRSIVNSLRQYKTYSLSEISRKEAYFRTFSDTHKYMMKDYLNHLNLMKRCIIQNDLLIQSVLIDVDRLFVNVDHTERNEPNRVPVPERDMAIDLPRIEATFKHIYRDWSAEGAEERQLCYQPILTALAELYEDSRQNRKVLVPGAALGRLVFEIARLGFDCQGNEFSLFMMFFSQFLLNRCEDVRGHIFYPWIHQLANFRTSQDQIAVVTFPDVCPKFELRGSTGTLSMAAGDFVEVYKTPCSWDCVVTCFFIDCARNIAEFIGTIFNILKHGGHWINLGPLLYHFSNLPHENSVEPSYEIVKQIITSYGFIIKTEETRHTKYCQSPKSMMQYSYDSVFFVCQKPDPYVINLDSDSMDPESFVDEFFAGQVSSA